MHLVVCIEKVLEQVIELSLAAEVQVIGAEVEWVGLEGVQEGVCDVRQEQHVPGEDEEDGRYGHALPVNSLRHEVEGLLK